MSLKINKPKIIVIVGPTASGKSDLAIKIAKKISAGGGPASGWQGAEIISADSRQVYRGMDIGTGKVPRDNIKKLRITNYILKNNAQSVIRNKIIDQYCSSEIRHHLIDVVSPKKQFTADDFKRLGQKAIVGIVSRGKIPIIVGGTGFYIDVLLSRMPIAEVPPDKKLRKHFDKLTLEHLFKMLQKLDPQHAKTIDPKNKRRLIRALEIVLTTNCPVPEFNTKYNILNTKYSVLWLGINPGKEKLAIKIKNRLDARLKQGMIKEVVNLRKQGVNWKRLDDFGLEYRWISRYLRDNRPLTIDYRHFVKSDFYEMLLREIIKYSKRQMTWFKRNKKIHWINPSAGGRETEKLLTRFLH